MFLTTVKLQVQSSKRKEIIQTLLELADRMQGEAGCTKATLYQDVDDRDTLYFLREWQGQEQYETLEFSAVLLGMEPLLDDSLEITRAINI